MCTCRVRVSIASEPQRETSSECGPICLKNSTRLTSKRVDDVCAYAQENCFTTADVPRAMAYLRWKRAEKRLIYKALEEIGISMLIVG